MKYKTIEIRPFDDGSWHYLGPRADSLDRVKTKTQPHPMGFFHYLVTFSDEEAFNQLKNCILESHEKEIKRLKKSADKLKLLKFKLGNKKLTIH